MKVPVATAVRSVSARRSAAGGGGKTNGKKKNPSATPKPVPSTPPSRKIARTRQKPRIGRSPDRERQACHFLLRPAISADGPEALKGSRSAEEASRRRATASRSSK